MNKKKLSDFLQDLLAEGRYTFTLEEARKKLGLSDSALNGSLFRVSQKGLAHAVRKGFYVIIPPQYRTRGMLPPSLFIDDLMNHLGREYYTALLSAAALHGTAHQQPQEFHVVTAAPAMRGISGHGIRIHFFTRRVMAAGAIEEKKTDTGVIRVACPALTAIDLLLFEKRIGGISRAAEVLVELAPLVDERQLVELATSICPLSVVQRLGYVLDCVGGASALSDSLFGSLRQRKFFPVPLSTASRSVPESGRRNRWNVRVNAELDLDQ